MVYYLNWAGQSTLPMNWDAIYLQNERQFTLFYSNESVWMVPTGKWE